jgi:hypothetical protein
MKYSEYLTEIRKHAWGHVCSLALEQVSNSKRIEGALLKSKKFSETILDGRGSAIANVFDIEELSYLGSGTHGSAFDCGNGKVLKITNDKSEFNNCSNIVGMIIPNVMNVYKVAVVKDQSVYFIQYKKYDLLRDVYPEIYTFFENNQDCIVNLFELVAGYLKGNPTLHSVEDVIFNMWKEKLSSNAQEIVSDIEAFVENCGAFSQLGKDEKKSYHRSNI